MSPLTIDFGQGNQLENKGKVRENRILKLVATLVFLRHLAGDPPDLNVSCLE